MATRRYDEENEQEKKKKVMNTRIESGERKGR